MSSSTNIASQSCASSPSVTTSANGGSPSTPSVHADSMAVASSSIVVATLLA